MTNNGILHYRKTLFGHFLQGGIQFQNTKHPTGIILEKKTRIYFSINKFHKHKKFNSTTKKQVKSTLLLIDLKALLTMMMIVLLNQPLASLPFGDLKTGLTTSKIPRSRTEMQLTETERVALIYRILRDRHSISTQWLRHSKIPIKHTQQKADFSPA